MVIRKPWDEDAWDLNEHGGVGHGTKLCFAIMWDNGVVKPHPPLIRAMQMTKEALEYVGHKGVLFLHTCYVQLTSLPVIDWEPHRHLEIYKNAVR